MQEKYNLKDEDKKEEISKFARPDSLQFRTHFAQKRRKDRKKKNIDSGLLPNERP